MEVGNEEPLCHGEGYTKGEDRETDKSRGKTRMKALELRVPHYRSRDVLGLRVVVRFILNSYHRVSPA